MGLLSRLGLDEEKARIDREMTPADTYGLFECQGLLGGWFVFLRRLWQGLPQRYGRDRLTWVVRFKVPGSRL